MKGQQTQRRNKTKSSTKGLCNQISKRGKTNMKNLKEELKTGTLVFIAWGLPMILAFLYVLNGYHF